MWHLAHAYQAKHRGASSSAVFLKQSMKTSFQKLVLNHFARHGRKLPWRAKSATPYHILVSEIMLQQTQANRVIPKYKAFLKKFPSNKALANSSPKEVLIAWSGLGYNRRALNLKRTAEIINKTYAGKMPRDYKSLLALPGIGSYTANALLTFAFNKPVTMIETNIRSVFLHHFFPKQIQVSDKKLMSLIEKELYAKNPRQWYGALMDYGSYLKETTENPSRKSLHHKKQSRFEGSDRQLRGKLLNALTEKSYTAKQLEKYFKDMRVPELLKKLHDEGLIRKEGLYYVL